MPNPNPQKIKSFTTPNDLHQWLEQNHASESELWVKIFKKASGIQSVSWDDVVIEVLCWGWIDGVKKSIDSQAYLQRITPRRPKSSWSKRNRAHVERLTDEGIMQEPGLVQVRAAKEDGRWDNAYAVSEMTVPEDFLQALKSEPEAKRFYDTLPKSSRYVIAHGLLSAKKSETRERRFLKYLEMLIAQKKPA